MFHIKGRYGVGIIQDEKKIEYLDLKNIFFNKSMKLPKVGKSIEL